MKKLFVMILLITPLICHAEILAGKRLYDVRSALVSMISSETFVCTGYYDGPMTYDINNITVNGKAVGFTTFYINEDLAVVLSLQSGVQPELTIANYTRNGTLADIAGNPTEGDGLYQAMVYTSADDKKITSIVFLKSEYVNIGTLSNPQIGLQSHPELQTTCVAN